MTRQRSADSIKWSECSPSGIGRRLAWLAGLLAAGAVACGGGTVEPPPPPPPPPPASLNLAVGELATLTDASAVRSFGITGGAGTREYAVIVHSASEVSGSSSSMRLTVTTDGASGNVIERGAPLTDASPAFRALEREDLAALTETRLKRRMREELRRVGARPYRGTGGGGGPRLSLATGAPPTVGQRITFSMAVTPTLAVNCNSVNQIQADVKLVGETFVFVEDVRAAGSFSAADYQELNASLDDVVAPLLIEYYGEPPDLDGNERVFILFTANVNEMTEPGSGTFVAGFFFAGDLLPDNCPASNQAEMLYLMAADPDGKFGDPVEVEFAKRVGKGTVAHEFQHLLNATQRLLVGGGGLSDQDDTWSDEGLSHVAEEVSGLALAGMSLRSNLGASDVLVTESALDLFNAYHLFNFSRFGSFLFNPHSTLALGETGGGDPPGEQSLEMRGFAWSFLRWLADQYAPSAPAGILPGSGEHLLFRELASGGPNLLTGTANVQRAVQVVSGQSPDWQQLIADYLSVPVGDDNGSGLDPTSQLATWNLRDMYLFFNQSNLNKDKPFNRPYPLVPLVIDLAPSTNTSRDFTVNSSTGRFFTLRGSGPTPDVSLEVTTQTGGDVPGSVRVQATVLRIR